MCENLVGDDSDSLLKKIEKEISTIDEIYQLNLLKSRYLGRSGLIRKRFQELRDLSAEEKVAMAKVINHLQQRIENFFRQKKEEIEILKSKSLAEANSLDVTLPGRRRGRGGIHPLQQVIDRIQDIFSHIGFETTEGPEIETDYYNFTALNQPENHPARSMHDTFYFKGNPNLLRTHTSPVQIRYIEGKKGKIPIRAISPGRVFRRDHDSTHSPMFHQVEGIWVDEVVRFSDLKGVLAHFFRTFFKRDDIEIRFRPSFFPFTEPSAECDIKRGDNGNWLEVGGCGMIHPSVLKAVDLDSRHIQGFAFGMGVERLAMLYYGISDIRLFFENDIRFLSQFG